MNIGFVTDSITEKMAGIGHYSKNIFLELSKQGQNLVPVDWRAGSELSTALGIQTPPPVLVKNRWPVTKTLLWHSLLLRRLRNKTRGLDLVFCCTQFLHLAGRLSVPYVYVVCDVSFLTFPECHKRGKKILYQLFFRRTLQKADHIVCISQHTRLELLKHVQIPAEKISVIYPGVHARFKPVADDGLLRAARAKYKLPDRFFLYVGTIEPRKNLENLFLAFDRLKNRLALPLLVVGKIGWRSDPIMQLHEKLGLAEKVRFLGYVPDDDLPVLYSLATACTYVSKEEGFGLPLVEAMRCGTPVLISDAGSLLEVSQGAALVTAPDDVEAIGQSLVRLSEDEALLKQLAEKGLARAQDFSWEKAAGELIRLFQQMTGRG